MSVNPMQYFMQSVKRGMPSLDHLLKQLTTIDELQEKYHKNENTIAYENLKKALYCQPHEVDDVNFGTLSEQNVNECQSSTPTTTTSTVEPETKEQ
jgi:hypothetical protein